MGEGISFEEMLKQICAETYKDESDNNKPNKLNKDFPPNSPEFSNLLSGHLLYSKRYKSKKYQNYNKSDNNYNAFLRCINREKFDYAQFKAITLDAYEKAYKRVFCCVARVAPVIVGVFILIGIITALWEKNPKNFLAMVTVSIPIYIFCAIVALIVGGGATGKQVEITSKSKCVIKNSGIEFKKFRMKRRTQKENYMKYILGKGLFCFLMQDRDRNKGRILHKELRKYKKYPWAPCEGHCLISLEPTSVTDKIEHK
jgi:hypothetical protein